MSGAELGDGYLGSGNLTLRMLQALVQANVINQTTNTPPSSPNDGDTYIVGASSTGAWVGKNLKIAYWTTQNLSTPSWDFWTPAAGWLVYDNDTAQLVLFDGAAWNPLPFGDISWVPLRFTGNFNGAGTAVTVATGGAFTNTNYNVLVNYIYPTTAAGILSVEIVDANSFKIHSSSGTDASFFRGLAVPQDYNNP